MSQLGWNQLKKFHRNPPTVALNRSPTVQQEYDEFKEKTDNVSLTIERRLFKDSVSVYRYVPNSFPYNIEPGIEHNLLWVNPNLTADKNNRVIFTNDTIVNEIIKSETDGREYIYFKNKQHNASVQGIIHYHVFVKKEN